MNKHNLHKKTNKQTAEIKLPPFNALKAASQGNSEAMMEILNHYGDYINRLSIRKYYDGNGQIAYFVDDTLRKRLEIALTLAISKFNIM